jgi:hypothetical protein
MPIKFILIYLSLFIQTSQTMWDIFGILEYATNTYIPYINFIWCLSQNPDRLWDPLSSLLNGYRKSFPGRKRPVRELNHPSSSSVEVKNEWSYTSSPPVYLNIIDRDNFTFSFSSHQNGYFFMPVQPLIQRKNFPAIKQLVPKLPICFLLQRNIEFKNIWSHISLSPYVFMMWCLIQSRDIFDVLRSFDCWIRPRTIFCYPPHIWQLWVCNKEVFDLPFMNLEIY